MGDSTCVISRALKDKERSVISSREMATGEKQEAKNQTILIHQDSEGIAPNKHPLCAVRTDARVPIKDH